MPGQSWAWWNRAKALDGARVRPGDVIIGLESNGLHTNGYSLARKVLFETMGVDLKDKLPGLKKSVGEELLRVHKNYQPLLATLPEGMIKGLATLPAAG